jgi:hypothetical protein
MLIPRPLANKYLPKIFPMASTHDRHAHRRFVVVLDGARVELLHHDAEGFPVPRGALLPS